MAHKIPVANSSDKLKKSVALLLIRRLVAVGQYDAEGRLVCVHRVAVNEQPRKLPIVRCAAKPYIPEKLPAREIPGVWFQEPQSYTWKLLHRAGVTASSLV